MIFQRYYGLVFCDIYLVVLVFMGALSFGPNSSGIVRTLVKQITRVNASLPPNSSLHNLSLKYNEICFLNIILLIKNISKEIRIVLRVVCKKLKNRGIL